MNWVSLRAACAVAGIYGAFLIFAQFSFVELIRAEGIGETGEKIILGAMALAGIAAGFVSAWRGTSPNLARASCLVLAASAAVAPLLSTPGWLLVVALVTGASLGAATVSLSAMLRGWCRLPWVGLGTGIGYACCNIPWIFQQGASVQAWTGAGFALLAACFMPGSIGAISTYHFNTAKNSRPWLWLLLFTILVWTDSAAFFIIQHASDLKTATWGPELLWRNAIVHLFFAMIAGYWLGTKRATILPAAAWILLAIAAMAVNEASYRPLGGVIYPAAVSLYSTALIAWPGWFSDAKNQRSAAWRAAWLFAVAGWFGSANGIAMAQSLQRVPVTWIAVSAAVILLAVTFSRPERFRVGIALSVILAAAWLGSIQSNRSADSALTAAERGRKVYLSEGCIHCHSQYIRPSTADESIWGPARSLEETRQETPVIIGNRRQGPDLRNIGARRSAAWLKAHFIDPRAIVPDSPMPSYRHLFEDTRGEDLVQYLSERGVDATYETMLLASQWEPRPTKAPASNPALFARHCASCHGPTGRGDGPMAVEFPMPPTNLQIGPFAWTADGPDLEKRIARVIKFGIAGSAMAGHETLSDDEILALTRTVLDLRSGRRQSEP